MMNRLDVINGDKMTRDSVRKQQLGGLTIKEYINEGYETDVFTLIDEIFDNFESRNCTNCDWIYEEVCTNPDSRLCADFVSDSDICLLWEIR